MKKEVIEKVQAVVNVKGESAKHRVQDFLQWSVPRISEVQFGGLNKFGLRRIKTEENTHIDGVSVKALAEEYGAPLFVASESRLRHNARMLQKMFENQGVKAIHGWSYKTNYTSAICNVFHQEGCLAEVVSSFEYDKARRLGVPGSKIIFNGPNKSREALKKAFKEKARVNIDHFDELALVESIASDSKEVINVGVRLNFDTGFSEPWSRFGFNLESGAAREVIAKIIANPQLNLSGLHSHIGTFILDPRAYASQVKVMCDLMKEIEDTSRVTLDYIDIGGGLPSKNALHGVYLPPEQSIPALESYAAAICEAFKSGTKYRSILGLGAPELIFESGRAAVDDAMTLITSVVGRKELPAGVPAAILDAGVNILFTAFWYNHAVKLAGAARGAPRETVLYGPMCMNIDVVRASVQLPPLEPGDLLTITPVGAYNNTQWMQFIEYRPAIVMVRLDGSVDVIRRAENLDSMCEFDQIPEGLGAPWSSQSKQVVEKNLESD